MTVPLVDLQAQYLALQTHIDQRMQGVIRRGGFILGEEVRELEDRLADFCGARHAVTVANGTDALEIVLMAWNIGSGDAVFVPAFTFAATAEVVASVGAQPVFVDIDPVTYNMDPADLERRIEGVRATGQLTPRAVIPVDLFGQPADYQTIGALAERYGLAVLSDAAQSFGAAVGPKRAGSFGQAATTSFYPSKPLGCYGDGGAIFSDDERLIQSCRTLRGHGFDSSGEAVVVGMNSRLDTLQAAVLLAKLDVFAQELEARARAAAWYSARLKDKVVTPRIAPGVDSAWAVYAIRVEQRDALRQALAEAGISSAIYYAKPLHLHRAYAGPAHEAGSLPVCEEIAGDILALPMHGYLDEAAVEAICDVVLRNI